MVARNRSERDFQWREQGQQMIVFLFCGRIDEVTGYHYEVRAWRKAVESLDAACKRRRSIDFSVGPNARALDVQIGNLRDEDRPPLQGQSPGSRRIAFGSTDRPTRSPVLTSSKFGASTISALPAAPLTVSRCRSPVKLTLSTRPARPARWGATIAIDSGRIIAIAVPAEVPFIIGSFPPGNFSIPPPHSPSTTFAAPMNSATKRLTGAK